GFVAAGRRAGAAHAPAFAGRIETAGMRKKITKGAAPHRATSRPSAPSGRGKVGAGGQRNPLAGLELDARRAQRVRTAEALRGGRTPLTLIAVAEHAATVAEEGIQKAVQADPPPPSACKEGCDWCCHLTVGAGIPEIARIVEHLRQTLTAKELRTLHEK